VFSHKFMLGQSAAQVQYTVSRFAAAVPVLISAEPTSMCVVQDASGGMLMAYVAAMHVDSLYKCCKMHAHAGCKSKCTPTAFHLCVRTFRGMTSRLPNHTGFKTITAASNDAASNDARR
jgi:hypothetical protein